MVDAHRRLLRQDIGHFLIQPLLGQVGQHWRETHAKPLNCGEPDESAIGHMFRSCIRVAFIDANSDEATCHPHHAFIMLRGYAASKVIMCSGL